jgi:hypothetical protein
MTISLSASLLLKYPGISDLATYIILVIQVFFVGLIYGVIFMIQE